VSVHVLANISSEVREMRAMRVLRRAILYIFTALTCLTFMTKFHVHVLCCFVLLTHIGQPDIGYWGNRVPV